MGSHRNIANAALIEGRSEKVPFSGCWIWMWCCNANGYGELTIDKKRTLAHRLSFSIFNGPIGGKCVLHRCDVPSCVNPGHLFLGTQLENIADKMKKGRNRIGFIRGEDSHFAKLSEESATTILRSKGMLSATSLSSMYGVGIQSIYAIWERRNWKHLRLTEH